MNKGKKLYEGKAKILYETKEKGLAIQHFKDDATAFNNQKKANVEGKGVLNNRISEHILHNLNQIWWPQVPLGFLRSHHGALLHVFDEKEHYHRYSF